MRGLVQLILRFQNFLLFLLLQGICFSLVFTFNNYHRSSFVNSTSDIIGTIYEKRQEISEYLALRQINEDLSTENAVLKSRQPESFLSLQDDHVIVNDTVKHQHFSYISAKVINMSLNSKANFMTINRGSEHGVKPEMGVTSNNNIVGVVKDVSKHFSSIVPIINPGFQASVKLKSSGEQGILAWPGHSVREAEVMNIPPHAKIAAGDTIVTTGYSAYFPSDVMVGIVQSAEIRSGDNLYTAVIDLSTDYYKVAYVDVINNLMREEQKQLEALMLE